MKPPAISIRPIGEADLPWISKLLSANYRKLASVEGYSPLEKERLIEERSSPEAITSQSKRYTFAVAVDSDNLVGVVAIRGNTLEKLYVDSKHHHRGIGAMLFQWAESAICDAGYTEIVLVAFTSSVAFYEKMGMGITGRKTMTGGPLEGRQFISMRKPLGTD
jgi:ribosomal protein S18 acetylase RimI-like enzyme